MQAERYAMAEYTDQQLQQLRDRWKGHEEELRALVPIIKTNTNWHELKQYKDVMAKLPLPEGVEKVERDLRGAPLWDVDLSGAIMWGAQLSGAIMWRSYLSGTNLWDADLSGAFLTDADLSGAIMWEADLSGADLRGMSYTTDEILNICNLKRVRIPRVLHHIPLVKRHM